MRLSPQLHMAWQRIVLPKAGIPEAPTPGPPASPGVEFSCAETRVFKLRTVSLSGSLLLLLLSASVVSDSVRPHRLQPIRLHSPWDSPGKNTGVGCHFLLQCKKVKSESEVAQLCPTVRDPMDCSLPGSSIHGILQARVLEWVAIAFSNS